MQDPNEDTEWNDVLRAKGILPPKEKKVYDLFSKFSKSILSFCFLNIDITPIFDRLLQK